MCLPVLYPNVIFMLAVKPMSAFSEIHVYLYILGSIPQVNITINMFYNHLSKTKCVTLYLISLI